MTMTTFQAPISPDRISIYEDISADWAIVYVDGGRWFTGHVEDARERMVDLVGIKVTQVPSGFFRESNSGRTPEFDHEAHAAKLAGAD